MQYRFLIFLMMMVVCNGHAAIWPPDIILETRRHPKPLKGIVLLYLYIQQLLDFFLLGLGRPKRSNFGKKIE